jgi:toxin YoeB
VKVAFTAQGWADYLYWQEADPALAVRLNSLIKDASRSPFAGLGKPEPLRGAYADWWSRRINSEHRLVYRISGQGPTKQLEIAQCRYHY